MNRRALAAFGNMKARGPIKRNEFIRNLSRDNHYGLLLCWKIRTSLKKTDPLRIKKYTDYFFAEHLLPHFGLEEKYIFPLLGEKNALVQIALEDHKKLKTLFEAQENVPETLIRIGEELEKHIRFEERVLFKELQHLVPGHKLIIPEIMNSQPGEDRWADKFWEL